ncbi:MAG TPA: hypothetical protein PKI93_08780, partial [Alphaproteobacteria bacterium]|nr:hypothetical protein [Alphaproteobacteria bacterium]
MTRQFGLLVCLLGAGLTLSGCEAVKSMGRSVESGFESIEWPSFDGAGEQAPVAQSQGSDAGQSLVANLPENCPQLKVMRDISRISQFSNPKAPKAEEMIASAKLSGIDATCSVAPN